MRTYPISLVGLERQRAVVVGGGRVAARRVADLLEAGAQVTVISPTLTPELKSLEEARQLTAVS